MTKDEAIEGIKHNIVFNGISCIALCCYCKPKKGYCTVSRETLDNTTDGDFIRTDLCKALFKED